jgi:hypothetical protein
MGNRKARNTVVPGTGVEAIGDEEKMSAPRFHSEHADDNLGIPDDAGPTASDRIHKLIRERNALQARVKDMASIGHEIELATLKAADLADMEAKEAEARGYRRGVEDAAKNVPTNWLDSLLTGPNGIGQGPYGGRHIEKLMRGTRTQILALLEQTGDTNSPHLKSGAGNEKKI